MRINPSNALAAIPVVLIVASIAAGIYLIHVSNASRWRLTYHDSLASFADLGRVARCAWFVSNDVQSSSAAAIEALRKHDASAREAGCDWYEEFPEVEDKNIEWTRIGASSLQLCGEIRAGSTDAESMPVAAHFTFPEIGETPVRKGRHCYTINVTSAPVDDEWGHPLTGR